MMVAGDEFGRSQGGNNNAYCQDNETSWIDWADADEAFHAFTRRMIAFRKAHPILRQKLFLHSRERAIDGKEDLFWRRADGEPMTSSDWEDPDLKLVCVEMRSASGTPAYAALEYAIFAVFNAGPAVEVVVPDAPPGEVWSLQIDTSHPDADPRAVHGGNISAAEESVAVLVLEKTA